MFLKRFTPALLLLTFPLISHSAVISGYVYNIDDGIYVESARVRVAGTDISTLTGRGGRFRITGLDAGQYSLFASSTGFPAVNMTVVLENDYDEVTVNFNLSQESVFELDEFVVEGSLLGAARGMDIRRAARDYREVVSSDAAGQFTDRNPAEALQRVAGVTVEDNQGEGKFLIIRGSSPDLNAVQIDGVSLPTPEQDGRSVNLNVITVDQLERIELSKTWLPSQKANVIGGTVNLITRSALDRGERFGAIEFAGTYRAIQDDELSYRAAVTYGDYIGSNRFESLGDKAFGIQFSFNQSKDYTGSDTVTWGWTTGKAFNFAGTNPRGYTMQNQRTSNYNIDRDRKGGSARLEFRLNNNHEFYVSASINEFDDIEREHTFELSQVNTWQQYTGAKFLTLALVEEMGLDPTDPDIAFRLSQGQGSNARALTFEEAIRLGHVGYDPETKLYTRSGYWATSAERQFIHILRQDRIESYQMGGKHLLPWEVDAKWKVFQTEATQESFGNRIRFAVGGNGAQTTSIVDVSGANPYIEEHFGSNVLYNAASYRVTEPSGLNDISTDRWTTYLQSNDKRVGGDLDLEKQFNFGNSVWTTQVGYSIDNREKSIAVDNNAYGIQRNVSLDRDFWPLGRLQLSDPFFEGEEIDRVAGNFGSQLRFGPSFHEENTLALLLNPQDNGIQYLQDLNHFNNNVTSRLTTNYLADENINAFYYQQSIDWGKWSFIFGFRYEKTKNNFTNLELLTFNPDYPDILFIEPNRWRVYEQSLGDIFSREVTSSRSYDHILPALHLIREVGDNMRVRGSVTKTMARPVFTDLIPREVVNVAQGRYVREATLPAFDLMPMESINYDISVDYYLEPVGLFSIAVFYKDLDGPIYTEVRSVTPGEETLPWELRFNSQNANLAPGRPPFNNGSWEFRRRRNAGKAHLLGVEVTYDRRLNFLPGWMNGFGINSNISFMDSEATVLTEGREGEKVPLFRQPDMTANFSLYYEKHGLFARLSYNLRGRYLEGITQSNTLKDLNEPSNSLDTYLDRTARLDFTMRYNVWRGFQVFFEALNLTNEPQFRYRGTELRPHSKQYTDQVFTLGIKWNL